MSKNLSFVQVKKLFNLFSSYYNNIIQFNKTNQTKVRAPIFPESLSENIVRWFIINKEKRKCISPKIGDLSVGDKKIEVKCFTSQGPSSYGPNEPWDELWFLDASNIIKNPISPEFKIYKCTLSNKSNKWMNLKMGVRKTFKSISKKGIRPRISFSRLRQQIKPNLKLVYTGDLNGINK